MATAPTRQDSRFFTHQLDNGLQLIGQLIPSVESAAAVFWVRTGTRDEQMEQMGISHFLEHMAFRGTHRISSADIDRQFEEMGAEHNAGTWLEMTFYWARVLGENLGWAIDVLSEITHPKLDATDFDQERQVILEEIARYEDQPTHVLLQHFLHNLYGDNPLSWPVLGTPESIRAMKIEQLRDYWSRRYGTRNMVFSVAGNFDWELVVDQVDTLSKDWKQGETGRVFSPWQFAPGFHLYRREKFLQQQIAIGTPMVSGKDPRRFAASLLATILGDDTGSRLFWALNQTGVAESATSETLEFEDTGFLLTHISTEPGRAQEALELARVELLRLQDLDIQQDELDRAKAKLLSSVVIGGESTNERVMGLINSWLREGRLETLEETRERIDAVTLDDLRSLLRDHPVAPRQVITTVGPLSENEFGAPALS